MGQVLGLGGAVWDVDGLATIVSSGIEPGSSRPVVSGSDEEVIADALALFVALTTVGG